jgi:RHS repeat-associated protein
MASEVYTYDNVGNLLTKKIGDRSPKTMEYEYFAGYRVKKITEPDGRVTEYTYDNNDNIVTQSCPGVSYTYSNYDARNRAHGFTAQMDGNTFDFAYNYDVFGRMTSINYPNRANAVSYTYDELDRLQSIPGFVTSCGYDADNKITDMLFGNGVNNHYTYRSNDDKLAGIQVGPSGSLLNLSYNYDAVGNIKQINNDYYQYDGLNRLTWAGDQPNQRIGNGTLWSYDGAGNRTNHTIYANSVVQESIDYTYDVANRLWAKGNKVYTNDSNGNRIGKTDTDIWSYIYDGENRLTQVTKNGVDLLDNSYDDSGIRVKDVKNGQTTYYVYWGNNPLMEYSLSDSKYKYLIYAGNKMVAEEKDGVVNYYHTDHLGSTRLVTDGSRNKVAEYKFKPFGETENYSGTFGTNYQFTGKPVNAEVGLSYFGARFYDPEDGRFLTIDPARQGLNWYAYCNNNPINTIDPDGRCGVLIGDDPYTKQCSKDLSNWAKQNPNNIFAKAINALDSLSDAINNYLNSSVSGDMKLGIIFVAGPSLMADMAKSESLLNQALKGEGRIIAGSGTKTVLRDANRLATEYGGKPGEWSKMTTTSETLSDGRQIQVHYYVNKKTGQVVECKTKITPAKATDNSTNSTGSTGSTGTNGSSGSTEPNK